MPIEERLAKIEKARNEFIGLVSETGLGAVVAVYNPVVNEVNVASLNVPEQQRVLVGRSIVTHLTELE